MKFRNELKVGLAIVVAVLLFIVGVRYFEDIPIFSGTYELYTTFENAGGLVAGNPVRINGVNVGQVDNVRLVPAQRRAVVRFHIDRGMRIPRGSSADVSGLEALGSVRLDINLARASQDVYAEGDTLPSAPPSSFDEIFDEAPNYARRADSVLVAANTTFAAAEMLLASPQSELNRTLRAVAGSASALEALLRTEQQRLGGVLAGVDSLTRSLNRFAGPGGDSLQQALGTLNDVLRRLDGNLAALETTTARLDTLALAINRGDGTLGKLVYSDSLHQEMTATLDSLQTVLSDFKQHPARYLKALRLVDVF